MSAVGSALTNQGAKFEEPEYAYLRVDVAAARNVPVMDVMRNTAHTYVAIRLEGETVARTPVQRCTRNPKFEEEEYLLCIPKEGCRQKNIEVRLMNWGRMSDETVGMATLTGLPTERPKKQQWLKLDPPPRSSVWGVGRNAVQSLEQHVKNIAGIEGDTPKELLSKATEKARSQISAKGGELFSRLKHKAANVSPSATVVADPPPSAPPAGPVTPTTGEPSSPTSGLKIAYGGAPPTPDSPKEKEKPPTVAAELLISAWWDVTYSPSEDKGKQLEPLGTVSVRLQQVHLSTLALKEMGARLNRRKPSLYSVIRHGTTWYRLPTKTDTGPTFTWPDSYTFDVYDPTGLITIAIFDDHHRGAIKGEDMPVGRIRIRIGTLPSDRPHSQRFPLARPMMRGAAVYGEALLTVEWKKTADFATTLKKYIKPPKPAGYYQASKSITKGEALYETQRAVLVHQFKNEVQSIPKEAIKFTLDMPHPPFSLRRGRANAVRLKDSVGLVRNLADGFKSLETWQSPPKTILVTILWCFFCIFPGYLPAFLAAVACMVLGYGWMTRDSNLPVTDLELYGLNKNYQKKLGKDKNASLSSSGSGIASSGSSSSIQSQMDESELPTMLDEDDDVLIEGPTMTSPTMEEEPTMVEKPDQEDMEQTVAINKPVVPTEYIHDVTTLATEVQNTVGDVAAIGERAQALLEWRDPTVSGIFLSAAFVLCVVLLLIPLNWILFVVGPVLLRHPSLRNPLPPPPICLLLRIPSRANWMA
eukprot:TRINITY_DN93711_c0_g1_i1.p1 TRINITY_DN93711_c0_g1~~TRINITY_DN93711_c0_g1_i1.p1  ORF type:complete len:798 (-),score=112.29 TRINITY_DN93711_c0_g1_i1:9-2279(-)